MLYRVLYAELSAETHRGYVLRGGKGTGIERDEMRFLQYNIMVHCIIYYIA